MDQLDKHAASYSQFACIGSGFLAIGLGATLKRWYGISDVRFFERHSDLGGTWFVNTYPGCACDVPGLLYSFSFAPNARWTSVLPSSAELWAYLKQVADDHGLRAKMTFGANVTRCEWLEAAGRWRLTVRRLADGSVFCHECRFLFSGAGILVKPHDPELPGLGAFAGPVFHASRWPPGLDVRAKDVVVVGNGCTAAQIVPAVAPRTRRLTQFVRSKHWTVPPVDAPTGPVAQWLFAHVPGLLAAARLAAFALAERELRGFYTTPAAARFRARREARAADYVRRTAPPEYHDLLIPDFELGCKRRIHDPGYLAALHAPNVALEADAIAKVLPDAVRTRRGATAKADVLVLANGYDMDQLLAGVDVVGRGGVTLAQHWAEYGGPEAYNCCALSGFPNFFMILGPNATTGHTSTVMAVENSVNYALRILKPVLDGNATCAEVRPDAEARYSRQMQADLRNTVWSGGCRRWYYHETPGGARWNAFMYPYSQAHYWYKCLFPDYRDWHYAMPPGAPRRRALRRALTVLMWTGLLVSACLAVMGCRLPPLLTQSLDAVKSRLFVP